MTDLEKAKQFDAAVSPVSARTESSVDGREQCHANTSAEEAANVWFLKQPCDGRLHDHKGLIWIPIEAIPGLLAAYASHSNSELLERVQKLEQREKDLVATLARVQSNLGVAQYDIRKVAPDTRKR